MKNYFKKCLSNWLTEKIALKCGYLTVNQFILLQMWRIFAWKRRIIYHSCIGNGMNCKAAFNKALDKKFKFNLFYF